MQRALCSITFLFLTILLQNISGYEESLSTIRIPWKDCGDCDCFQISCDSLNIAVKCKCETKCGCPDGYVLENEGSEYCIAKESCYSYCPDGKIYSGWYDPNCKTCDNPNAVCPSNTAIGCYCTWGYVLKSNGDCVLPEDC